MEPVTYLGARFTSKESAAMSAFGFFLLGIVLALALAGALR